MIALSDTNPNADAAANTSDTDNSDNEVIATVVQLSFCHDMRYPSVSVSLHFKCGDTG